MPHVNRVAEKADSGAARTHDAYRKFPDQNRQAVELGIHPQLAALEAIVYPSSAAVDANLALTQAGTIEIAPVEAPLVVFVWSSTRIVPVRITELSITEEAFDPNLNPIRARIGLTLRVLGVNDLPLGHRGANLFMAHHRRKEQLAATVSAALEQLGVRRIS